MPTVTFSSITSVRYIDSNMDFFGTLKEPSETMHYYGDFCVRLGRGGDIVLSRQQSHGFSHEKIVKILARYKNHLAFKRHNQ